MDVGDRFRFAPGAMGDHYVFEIIAVRPSYYGCHVISSSLYTLANAPAGSLLHNKHLGNGWDVRKDGPYLIQVVEPGDVFEYTGSGIHPGPWVVAVQRQSDGMISASRKDTNGYEVQAFVSPGDTVHCKVTSRNRNAVSVPTTDYTSELRMFASGQAWKLPYVKLEALINAGYVNATGARLTDRGKELVK